MIPLQILAGDLHGLNTLEHQPAKVAAMEGIWETQKGVGFTIVGMPDEEARETRYAVKIPNAASLILTMSSTVRSKAPTILPSICPWHRCSGPSAS